MFRFLEQYRTQVIWGIRFAIVIAVAVVVAIQLVGGTIFWRYATLSVGNKIAITLAVVIGFSAFEVVAWCIWKLLTMVKRNTVFSMAAFRYVDIVMVAMVVGAVSVVTFSYFLALTEDAPGAIVMGGILAVMIGGVGLIVGVLRMLLAQAVALQTELDEVI